MAATKKKTKANSGVKSGVKSGKTSKKPAPKVAKRVIKAPTRSAAKGQKSKVKSVRRAASQPRIAKTTKPATVGKASLAAVNGSRGKALAPSAKSNGEAVRAAKLSKSDLEHFRALLIEKRRELLGDVGSMESEAFKDSGGNTSSPMHMADVGTDNFEQEFTLNLLESERKLLREISEAIARIDSGAYGVCEGTGQPIAKARLEATPWTKYCIEYARMMEQGHVSRLADGEERDADDDEEED